MTRSPNFTLGLLIGLLLLNCYAIGQMQPELAPTPPMGWNSWNYFGKQDINKKIVYKVIDAMVATGLKDAGYNYVVVETYHYR